MGNSRDLTRREFVMKSALSGATLLAPGVILQVAQAQDQGRFAPTDAGNSAPGANGSAILENNLLRIELNPKTGDITGLHNKRTGKDYIGAKKWARAFRLNVPLPNRVTGFNADYSANSFDSWSQTRCDITKARDGGTQIIKVSYPALESDAGRFQIEAGYSIRLPDGSDEAILQLEIANRTPHRIKEVFFPWISGVGAIEGDQTDTFVAPNIIQSSVDLRKPPDQGSNWEEYPFLVDMPYWPNGYSLSMPWMNFGGRREGLYLASLSHKGERHMLMVQNFGTTKDEVFGFAWAFPAYIAPGQSWHSPQIVLSLHSGDWHAAADKYRASLAGWYQKPNLPSDFKKTIGSFNSFYTSRDFSQIIDLSEDIRKYGLHYLVMWNFGDYYPKVLDEDDLSVDPPRLGQFTRQWGGLLKLKAANEKAREMGVNTGLIFSQRLWNRDTLTPELRALAEKWVLRRESGDPIVESWDHQHLGAGQWSNQQQLFGHLDYCMCSAVKDFQNFAIHNVVGVLSQAGYSTLFYDQSIETNLCFSPNHQHPDVSAPCMASHDFLKMLKGAMLESNKGAALMGEGWEVVSSQFLDAGWVWHTPANPEVFRYSLPWAGAAAAVDVDAAQVNRYAILGLHLAIVARGLENGKNLSDFPEFAQHLSRLIKLRERTERFWVDGTFQDDIGLQLSGAFGKVYQTPHEVAVFMANLTDNVTEARFELDKSPYGIAAASYSAISSNGSSEDLKAAEEGAALKVTKSLAPFEMIAMIFQRHDAKS
jgi:hypothetical protein